jgi:hypothetical protein
MDPGSWRNGALSRRTATGASLYAHAPVADDPLDVNRIASRLALILSGALAASAVHDDEAVRTSSSELLAEKEPLHRQGRESGKPELLWYLVLTRSSAHICLSHCG